MCPSHPGRLSGVPPPFACGGCLTDARGSATAIRADARRAPCCDAALPDRSRHSTVILYAHQIGICRRYRRRCPRNRPWAEFSAGQRMQKIGALDRGYGSRGPWIRGHGFGAVGSRRCTRGVSTPHRYSTCRSSCCTGMEKKSNCLPDCRRSYQQTSLGKNAWVPLGTAHSVCGVVAMSSLVVAIRCLAEGCILAHNHLATSCTSFA